MIKERPTTKEQLLCALLSKQTVIQQSTPLRRTESDLERITRQAAWLMRGW